MYRTKCSAFFKRGILFGKVKSTWANNFQIGINNSLLGNTTVPLPRSSSFFISFRFFFLLATSTKQQLNLFSTAGNFLASRDLLHLESQILTSTSRSPDRVCKFVGTSRSTKGSRLLVVDRLTHLLSFFFMHLTILTSSTTTAPDLHHHPRTPRYRF